MTSGRKGGVVEWCSEEVVTGEERDRPFAGMSFDLWPVNGYISRL
jgi:hypothetical protein